MMSEKGGLVLGLIVATLTGCAQVLPAREAPSRDALTAEADIVGAGEVSVSGSDQIKLAIRPDGLQRLWGEVGRTAPGKLDIWEQHRLSDGRWSDPVALQINGPGEDFDPVFSPDGTQLYFHSNRPGSLGQTDIYVADREGDFGFAEPRNLGPLANSESHEWAPWSLPDGRILFASSGWGGEGRHDLFIADPAGSGEPVNLGPNINTQLSEFDPALSADGNTLVFSRGTYGPDGANFAIWRSDRDENGAWQEARPVALGCGTYTIGLAFLPGGDFSFSSRCPEGGNGDMVILKIARESLDRAS